MYNFLMSVLNNQMHSFFVSYFIFGTFNNICVMCLLSFFFVILAALLKCV